MTVLYDDENGHTKSEDRLSAEGSNLVDEAATLAALDMDKAAVEEAKQALKGRRTGYHPSRFLAADQMLESHRAFDREAEQRAGNEGMTSSVRASRIRSAELLREATDRLAERTNDS